MSKQHQSSVDWGDHTVIDKNRLGNFLIEFDNDSDSKIEITNYEIDFDPHGARKRTEFLKYLKEEVPHFIFSKHKQEEIQDRNGWPYDKARRKIGNISNKSDGFYGELLLFLIMEGFLNSPLISHKMAVKEDYNTQVKGADGLYIGEFDGDNVVGYGEAKFYKDKSGAIKEAVEGVTEYHGVSGIDEREAELDVSREHLSEDLDKPEIKEIIDEVLTMNRSIPITHPILIAYEKEHYESLKGQCGSKEEALEMISEFHNRESFLETVNGRIEENPELQEIQLNVFFLRVADTDEFKNDLEELI